MSFTCPKLSSNSAEGSPGSGSFVSAGLQAYSESGHPLNLTYSVGTTNAACWSSGSSNDGEIKCSQTEFEDAKLTIRIKNENNYQLKFCGYWNDNSNGASNWYWAPGPRDVPPPGCKRTIYLLDDDKAGLFLKVLDTNGLDQLGFANMSFQNGGTPSAEGSPDDSNNGLVAAGLQRYHRDVVAASLEYQIGESNRACWNHGDSNDGSTTCNQTTFKDKRALIFIENTIPETLTFVKYWNDNKGGAGNWYIEPNADDTVPPDCKRIFVLKDNDRAGLYFKMNYIEFHMSFTCPKMSSNSAEGSPHTGLQTYSGSGTPVTFTYRVGTPNLACWSSGTSNSGKTVCPQTLVLPFDLRRWMGKVNEKYAGFKNQKLRQLFIPGTHDAACYNNSGVATPWVQTQQVNFHDQLMLGARYFDVRPKYVHEGEGEWSHGFHHGPITVAATLDDLISQVTAFYTEDWQKRQNEIIILDFTHFDNYDDKERPGALQSFFTALYNSSLNPYLIPQGSFGPNTTLNSLWTASTQQRVIASVNFDPSSYQNTGNIWNGKKLFADEWDGSKFWPNTDKQTDLIQFINNNISTFSALTNLWALQDLLTPGLTSSVYSLVDQAHGALYGPSGLSWRSQANIVIQDYYDDRTTIEAIIENIRRISP
ncbi:PI-PLC domain-containing protein [Cohnella faecalis]|uniref:Phosphatidylinositol diacylglycerol-lyase n=2 Tax=Cohnella faecalis TaxID=2315694 RepID=A0A398CV69_9BACL|nr:hypothetical protein [Cohnella faecalis]RIE04448.1 hypothetical protein D3H35_07640 [Cohnella faecalis]